jgi:saccharopine dehydrogenase-like NADP-dependent oxidoreductase
MSSGPVLIAGGYGIVGGQVAELLRERHPELPLALGGRRPEAAGALARRLGASAVGLDVTHADPLAGIEAPQAVIAAVNDPHDRLMLAAVRAGIPYVDITRWTSLVRRAALRATLAGPRAPVLLCSAWMAGVAPIVARACARGLEPLTSIDISILYALKDRAGEDSVEYMDRLAEPFETTVDGAPRAVKPLSDVRRVAFGGGPRVRVYRLDTPEQATLPLTTGAATVATRIGFDSATSTLALVALRRGGVLRLLAHPRLTAVRRSLLRSSGDGGSARIVIEVAGAGGARRAEVGDPRGQSHLTAVGAAIAVERVLGLDGAGAEPTGVRLPEQHPDLDTALETLRAHGVEIAVEP